MSKTAVVLFNLGGPDSKNAIRPFLLNFFMDPNIIPLPVPFRCFIAWSIAKRRSKREAGESYGELGDKSPLLENSQAQAQALEKTLNTSKSEEYKVFISMRYWHPMAPQVVREVRDYNPDRILILPLYPQFSTTTSWSSLQVWNKAMWEAGYKCPTSMVCCYPRNEGFIQASVKNIKEQLKAAKKDGYKDIRILFSAHGLPEDIIKKGDPYQWQCEESAEKIFKDLNLLPSSLRKQGSVDNKAQDSRLRGKDDMSVDWAICYQSRVGPKKWIGPSLDQELERAAKDNKAVIIYPHAFTQEHVETLVELDIEYREVAEELGIHGYYRAATVSTHPDYIKGMSKLVKEHAKKKGIKAEGGKCLCPTDFGRCCMRNQDKALYPPLKKVA